MALDRTAGGKLSVPPMVSEAAVTEMCRVIDDGKRGGYDGDRARKNRSESRSKSAAPFSFARIVNLRHPPYYEDAEPSLDPITKDETVPDLRPAVFTSLQI